MLGGADLIADQVPCAMRTRNTEKKDQKTRKQHQAAKPKMDRFSFLVAPLIDAKATPSGMPNDQIRFHRVGRNGNSMDTSTATATSAVTTIICNGLLLAIIMAV